MISPRVRHKWLVSGQNPQKAQAQQRPNSTPTSQMIWWVMKACIIWWYVRFSLSIGLMKIRQVCCLVNWNEARRFLHQSKAIEAKGSIEAKGYIKSHLQSSMSRKTEKNHLLHSLHEQKSWRFAGGMDRSHGSTGEGAPSGTQCWHQGGLLIGIQPPKHQGWSKSW